MNTRNLMTGALLLSSMLFAAPAWAQDTGGQANTEAAGDNAAKVTDPQIAAIVVAANQVDIDAAKLAKSRSHDKSVKAFAATMIRDHEASNKQSKALVKKLKVKPEANATSKSLTDGGKANMKALKKLKGAAFDKAYVDHEVAYHQQVLDAINNTLIPNAQNAQLKELLQKTAPVIQAHLEHAQKLQGELGGGTGTGGTGSMGGAGDTGGGQQ